MTNAVSDDAVAAALRTMIVPMKLPQEPDCPDDILEYLDRRIIKNQDLCWPNDRIRMLVQKFCWLHKSSNFSATNIHGSLKTMAPGQVRAFYMAAQNAVLMMHRLSCEPKLVEVYAWAAQLPPAEIFKTNDKPLRYRVPESVVKVEFCQLTETTAFSTLIYDLGVNAQPEALPSTKKAGETVPEERDTVHPIFVTQWLVRALGGHDVSTSREQGNALLKKVRDEARYGMGKLLWRRCPIWFALKSSAHLASRLTTGGDGDSQGQAEADLSFKLWVTDVIGTLYTCEPATRQQYYLNLIEQCGSSAMLEGAKKIARRVEKLEQKFSNDRWIRLGGNHVRTRCESAVKRRRVEKLEQKFSNDRWIRLGGNRVRTRCESAVKHVIAFLKATDANVEEPIEARVTLSENEVQEGLVHKLTNSWPTLQRLQNTVKNGQEQGSLHVGLPPAIPRLRNLDMSNPEDVKSLSNALSNALAEDAPRKIMAALNDVRENVMQMWKSRSCYDLKINTSPVVSILSVSLLKLLRTNLEVSAKFGKNDVRLESLHTVLVSVTIVLLLDRLNCALFPMLKEHKLGLPAGRDQFLNALCLAQRSEKEHLHSLEQYILERNRAHRTVLVSAEWKNGSFPTRFAKSCAKMRQIRSDIQMQCRKNEENKLSEYRRKRSQYDDLTSKVNSSNCKCYYNDYVRKVSDHCSRCHWEKEKDEIHVSYYERLLPPIENDQFAVVYELTEPTPLSCLREALLLIATDILDDPGSTASSQANPIYHWKDDNVLQTWTRSRSSPLKLSSLAKKWCQSHYYSQHITYHNSFVVDCAKNCRETRTTSDGKSTFVRDSDMWSWSLLKKCHMQLHQPRYQALQKYVCGWQHNENQVLCDKSEAHRDKKVASANIPLTEFEAIGMLRAGHRLQIERFLECMSQRSVSFREKDVVTASMALFWQVAPNSTGMWYRDAWSRIANSADANDLVLDCARHAQELLENARENWDGHNVLLVVTLFLRAVFEHIVPSGSLEEESPGASSTSQTPQVQRAQHEVARVLRFSRKIAKEWVKKIGEATDRCTQEAGTQKLLAKTAAVASTGVLTFMDHDLLMMHDDVADFLHLRAVAHDNQSVKELRQHTWQRQHHFHADAENLLQRNHRLIQDTPTCLDNFLQLHWGGALNTSGFRTNWQRHRKGAASDSWYHSEFVREGSSQSCKVEIDVLGGLFLIDGKPCRRLPESITSHAVYDRLFGPSVFAVEPDGRGGYITKSNVQGATFVFRDGKIPEIEEVRNGVCSILVPDSCFKIISNEPQSTNDFPRTFIQDYSHWITRDSAMLYFRPKSYAADKFKSFDPAQDLGIEYVLDLETRMTRVVQKNGWFLVDIANHTHKTLFKNIFHRVCVQPDLHVFAQPLKCLGVNGSQHFGGERNSVLAEVRLPRLQNLRFDLLKFDSLIKSPNPIRATDYRDLCVAANQNFGTLYGLQHGLLLEGPEGSHRQYEKRVLLMPHGKTKRISREKIVIDVDNLREPAFFKYELRDELQEVHPPKPRHATTYLSLLHAITSGLFPDPFLGCTGTQKSISLLQSGRCCGNLITSMEDDVIEILAREVITLADIANISPARNFYPPNLEVMEVVEWPSSFEPLCAHNSFAFLAMQRMDDMSNTLKLICKTHKIPDVQKEAIQKRTGHLSKRAMLTSSLPLYPMDCNLDDEEFSRVFGNDDVLCEWTGGRGRHYIREKGFNSHTCDAISVIGCCGHNFQAGPTDVGLVKGLLQSSELKKLRGWAKHKEGRQTGEATRWANIITETTMNEQAKGEYYTEFHNAWITLYNIARKRGTWGSDEGKRQFTFLVSFLAQRYPSHRDHLVQLLHVCKNGSTFEQVAPPEYGCYKNPAEDKYDSYTIENTVEDVLEKFAESSPWTGARDYSNLRRQWEGRKHNHNTNRQNSKNLIIAHTRNAWSERRDLYVHEVNYEKVASPCELRDSINTYLTNWKKSEQLSNFTERFSEALTVSQNKASLHSLSYVSSITAKVDVSHSTVDNFSEQFRLITLKGHDSNSSALHDANFAVRNQEPPKPLTAPEILSRFVGRRNPSGGASIVPSFPLTLDDVVTSEEFREMAKDLVSKLETSWQLAHETKESVSKLLIDGLKVEKNRTVLKLLLEEELRFSREKKEKVVAIIQRAEAGPSILESTGLWNNTSVSTILSKFSAVTAQLYGEFGLTIRRVQRATRCLRLLDQGDQVYARLARELENTGSCGWDPFVYPEWLLLELDNDFCIREHQAEVAKEFLSDEMINQLLQQNMGEGKTDVIVPMIMAHFGAVAQRANRTTNDNSGVHLSDRMSELCCITVLNSLYPSNSITWQWRIGGLLGQRVYPMLFRRDLAFGKSEAAQMLSELEYITQNGHVVVTVPEQRLSQENKVVELASSTAIHSDTETSEALLKVLRFLKNRCRNFLDESDMILSPLYQLVYTLGDPVDMDGGVLRWSVAAAALKSVSDMAPELQARFQDHHLVEVHLHKKPRFSAVRLLDGDGADEVWDFIRKRVLEDVLEKGTATKHLEIRPKLLPEERERFQRMVLDSDVDTREIQFCESTMTKNLKRCAEILRGLLTHDALRFALGKRWRVDFGSHPSRLSYLMAVPYRYKDVAADRTEFKHPDVMLLHTLQHYYHKGLLSSQLSQVFQKLGNMVEAQAKALFNEWANQSVQTTSGIPMSAPSSDFRPVLDYTSVNCADAAQFKQQLEPQFQFHMETIDFFLFRKVFPVQAKQFPNEISANSWDLCPTPRGDARNADEARFPTKGFSGTDGTQPILPATVTQRNLPSGEITNGLQMRSLLHANNDEVSILSGTDANAAQSIVDLLKTHKVVNMVLDPGALILEMDNREFAASWLAARPDMEAAVFFNERDKECVITQANLDEAVERIASPYADSLSRCLIYLDDVHTRGVDFLLPLHSRAILTLGKGLGKDELLQAAMRLRQLGPDGQSLHFVASAEVGEALKKYGVQPGGGSSACRNSAKIFSWTLSNTIRGNCDRLPYYAAQGADHFKRCRAFAALSSTEFDPPSGQNALKSLAEAVIQSEDLTVSNMYGAARSPELLKDVVSNLFREFLNQDDRDPDEHSLVSKVMAHIQSVAPNVWRLQSKFGQEMERELEQELEEEINMEKPQPAKPAVPSISGAVPDFLQGRVVSSPQEVYPLHLGALTHTTLNEMVPGQFESKQVFVTRDFCRTIKASHALQDGYTKIPRWVLATRTGNVVVLSNFEAEFAAENYPSVFHSSHNLRMHLFSAIRRLRQSPHVLTRDIAFDAHPSLHVYAGSIQPEPDLLDKMRLYMGLVPHNTNTPSLIRSSCVDRDGFVPPLAREVFAHVPGGRGLEASPFQKSPVCMLQKLYSDIYGLGEELATSNVGKLLGTAQLDGHEG